MGHFSCSFVLLFLFALDFCLIFARLVLVLFLSHAPPPSPSPFFQTCAPAERWSPAILFHGSPPTLPPKEPAGQQEKAGFSLPKIASSTSKVRPSATRPGGPGQTGTELFMFCVFFVVNVWVCLLCGLGSPAER